LICTGLGALATTVTIHIENGVTTVHTVTTLTKDVAERAGVQADAAAMRADAAPMTEQRAGVKTPAVVVLPEEDPRTVDPQPAHEWTYEELHPPLETFTYGKHNRKSFEDVHENHPEYIIWLCSHYVTLRVPASRECADRYIAFCS
jgi:hypothetical protein